MMHPLPRSGARQPAAPGPSTAGVSVSGPPGAAGRPTATWRRAGARVSRLTPMTRTALTASAGNPTLMLDTVFHQAPTSGIPTRAMPATDPAATPHAVTRRHTNDAITPGPIWEIPV